MSGVGLNSETRYATARQFVLKKNLYLINYNRMRTQRTAKGNRDAGSTCSCDRGLHRYLRNFGEGWTIPPPRYATAIQSLDSCPCCPKVRSVRLMRYCSLFVSVTSHYAANYVQVWPNARCRLASSAEMIFMRTAAKYTRRDYKMEEDILSELKINPVVKNIKNYVNKLVQHVW